MLLSSYYATAYCTVSLIADSSWQPCLAAVGTRFKFNSHESGVRSPLTLLSPTLPLLNQQPIFAAPIHCGRCAAAYSALIVM